VKKIQTEARRLTSMAQATGDERLRQGSSVGTASKEALRFYWAKLRWKVAFFEGATGAPRTGIIDAIAYRNADLLDVRLVQLKAGVSGSELPTDFPWGLAISSAGG
jgi:hypothetical protein